MAEPRRDTRTYLRGPPGRRGVSVIATVVEANREIRGDGTTGIEDGLVVLEENCVMIHATR